MEALGCHTQIPRPYLLRHFELSAVPQIFRDAGGAEGMAADLRPDAGVGRAAADHAVGVGLAHRAFCEIAGLPLRRAEQEAVRNL
jgi:hypothetical protein